MIANRNESEAAHRLVIVLGMLHSVLAKIEEACPDSDLTSKAWCLIRHAQRDAAEVFDEMKAMSLQSIVANNNLSRRR